MWGPKKRASRLADFSRLDRAKEGTAEKKRRNWPRPRSRSPTAHPRGRLSPGSLSQTRLRRKIARMGLKSRSDSPTD